MQLYSYQQNAINAILSDPSHSQLISMPTGTGKTITFLTAIQRLDRPCLVLVHRQELLDQTKEKAKLIGFKDEEISLITSESKQDLNKLTIAMVQTLSRNLDKYDAAAIQMIVIDEAHHTKARSYLDVIRHFRIFEDKKMLLGFTATPLRGDKKELSDLFQSHSFKMTISEATQNGYICPVHGMRVDIERSLENIDTKNGDYDIGQLDHIMNCDAINNLIADRCENLSKTPSLIFCTSVDHARKLAALLRKKKKKAISVSYETPKNVLDKTFGLLKSGRLEFITNAVKLSEGFDYPPIQTIILARPTRSPVLYKQMIGRGLRNAENKHDCFVLEFAGNDKSMICWEDIDQNCTFQSSNLSEKKSRSDAIKFYEQRFFNSRIFILDVRVSPFEFYECKIRRQCQYARFYRYIPFEEGFAVGELRINPNGGFGQTGYLIYGFICFWKEIYKSFYVWDGGGMCGPEPQKINRECAQGFEIKDLEKFFNYYASMQPDPFGKWYPSEEEPMTQKQKSYLIKPEKISSRKAEMFIEDAAIKQAIKRYWIDQKMPDIDGNSFYNPTSTTKIYQLTGRY
jgi:superfamily II DNA or RNA helicase